MSRIVYSAYNAAVPDLATDRVAEDAWYARLRAEPRIAGLELGVRDAALHPAGASRLAELLSPEWTNTVSAMPMTLVATASDPDYGLASRDPRGRRRALDDIERSHAHVRELQDLLGADSVLSFAVHAAPRADRADRSHFADSLAAVVGLDWGGIEILVEHSDALVEGQEPQKGYLRLADELAVVREVGSTTSTRVSHLLNWGRSAIELRGAHGSAEHLAQTGTALGAFAFSGASPDATERSRAWEDVHLGLADDEPASLLTRSAVEDVVALLPDDLAVVGVKVGAAAGSTGVARLDLGFALLTVVQESLLGDRGGRLR